MNLETRKAARRQALMTAGIELLGTVGIADTKLTDICEHAGLTQRYFYDNFDSLSHFVTEVVRTVAVDVGMRALGAGLQNSTDKDAALAILAECGRIIDDDPHRARILLVETMQVGGELAQLRKLMLTAASNGLQMLRDPRRQGGAAPIMQMFVDLMQGAAPADPVDEKWAPGAIVMAGATAEVLMARLEGRLDLNPDALPEYLSRLLDFTVSWGDQGDA